MIIRFLRTVADRSINLLLFREYFPTEYFVFDALKLVYISIPKVACTSIKLAIMGGPEKYSSVDEGLMSVHRALSEKHRYKLSRAQQNYYIFAFVRNPFDRLVSCYEDKVKRTRQHNGKYYFSSKYNKVLVRWVAGATFHPDMTFDEFVDLVAKVPDAIADGHFKSQYSTLYKRGKRVPHLVGRFEDIESDWSKIAQKFNLNSLPSSNRTDRQKWVEYYTNKQTIELVYSRFQHDIEGFGYKDSYELLLSNNA